MNNDYEKKVGRRIKSLRIKTGLTQDQLSAKMQILECDVTRSALAKIEVGQRHIYIDEINVLKQIFEISYDELLENL